jgi:hypothetical protein
MVLNSPVHRELQHTGDHQRRRGPIDTQQLETGEKYDERQPFE